jgi:hypothetical protein
MANLWVAETHLLPRAELAYPESFVPDMNPRLQCLVLTRIPRYSTGPLIDKLITFLKLASLQEGKIQEVRATTSSRRGPAILLGLRHIRLEFEADPSEELDDDVDPELLLDPAAVMDDSSKGFSFFGDSHWVPSPATTNAQPPPLPSTLVAGREKQSPASAAKASQSARPGSPPAGPGPSHLTHTWAWNGQTCTLPIWIGSTPPPPSASHPNNHTPAVAEYMRLLRAHPDLRTGPVPASPCHVAAGVPAGSYLFSAAWDAMLVPPSPTTNNSNNSSSDSNPPKPTRAELRGMRDVVAAIKAYRAQTRTAYDQVRREARRKGKGEVRLGEPHFHWMGRLEVLLVEDPMVR